MTRPSPLVLLLLAMAVGLLALSFAPWGQPAAASDAPAAAGGMVEPMAQPTAAPTQTAADLGRTLFGIKGCAACHRHDGLPAPRLTQDGDVVPVSQRMMGAGGAPDLTHYQPDADFIRTWLKDPQALRPGTMMPNLRLKEVEIEALLAFLQTNKAEEN